MKLNEQIVAKCELLQEKGISLFCYDREAMRAKTLKEPIWIHFGAGNIFRGFPAVLHDQLLNEKRSDRGIIVAEGYDPEIIDRVYSPYDDLNISVTLKEDGSLKSQIVGSIAQSLKMNEEADFETLIHYFKKPSLQMVTFTITEKGYAVNGTSQLRKRPEESNTLMGQLTYLCYQRYLAGAMPLSLVSLDNCSKNGQKLYEAVSTHAKEWIRRGYMEEGFMRYIEDGKKLAFPWTMIDKITPHPSEMVKEKLEELSIESTKIIETAKHTFVAPFVNAEETQYLVIEDLFPNGRPALEEAGVIFTDCETVERIERMKVCTCLNPLHTALAIFGCLLGYDRIYEEMKNESLCKLVHQIGYEEGLPVVTDPKVIEPKAFLKEVIEKRLTNPFIPDSPWRIIADTSQKVPIRFGETIKAYAVGYVAHKTMDPAQLVAIPLAIAGWCRYLMGINDQGKAFDIVPDPRAGVLSSQLAGIQLGDKEGIAEKLMPILSDETLFGVNLYDVNLGRKIEDYFKEMISEKGSVAKTLEKYMDMPIRNV